MTVLAGLSALAASACVVAPAQAGEYDVWSCRGPLGQPLSAEAWEPRSDFAEPGEVNYSDGCASGGPIALDMTNGGTAGKARLDLNFDLPRGARVTGYRLNRAMRAAATFFGGPSHVYVAAVRESTAGVDEDWGCASYLLLPNFNCSFDGSVTDPDDPSNQWVRSGLSLDALSTWVGCLSAGCDPPFSPPAAFYYLWGSRVTVEDNSSPTIFNIGGTLSGTDPVRGKANLFVRARDTISGVARMDLEVDGQHLQTLGVDTPECEEPYVVSRPCLADAGLVFTVDTDQFGPGHHDATGTVTDAAGNQTSFGPVPFVVAEPDPIPPGPPEPDNGVPAVERPVISVDADQIVHPVNRPATVTGRLRTDSDIPVAGAELTVQMTQMAVADPRTESLPSVRTGRDGSFSVPVPGAGARRIEIGFAPIDGAASTATAQVAVRSRLALAFRARPARIRIGRPVRFTGRLAGAGQSAAGVPVEIQARVSGRWETVATVRGRANGTYVWRYRFRYVKRKALFSFRAVVNAAPGWPWQQTRSPVRKVRISVGRR